jgi:23S rRNA pseudouridine2605 synthase
VDGRRIKAATRLRYLLLNKPRGHVTTRRDPQRRRTVMDLIPRPHDYVYLVGRLDYDSEGLLLLTNDGDLAAALTHPRHEVERVYRVEVAGTPDARSLHRLSRGIILDGSVRRPRRLRSCSVKRNGPPTRYC